MRFMSNKFVTGLIPADVLEIAEIALIRAGRTFKASPTLQRHSSISTILSFPTDDGIVWFKYVPPLFAHEGAMTHLLARIAPNNLPQLIEWDAGWMLMKEFSDCGSPISEHPLATLAYIQRESTHYLNDLATAGCPRQPLELIVTKLTEFANVSELISRDQAMQLQRCLLPVSAACEAMTALAIPTTVVHGDFYMGNAHRTLGGWIVYDWTDAFIGNPFIDVTDPIRRGEPGAAKAFCRVWLEILPTQTVAQAMRLASIIGTAHYIIMHEQIMMCVADPSPFRNALDMWLNRLYMLTAHAR